MLIKIPETSDHKCDSCGLILNAGDLFYHCRTEIIADKGQTPVDLNFPDKLIAQALFELESRGEQEILDDIYQEIILLLCPKCCAIVASTTPQFDQQVERLSKTSTRSADGK